MNDFPTYEIRTVADFLKVPADRVDACLKEFAAALEVSRLIDDLSEMIAFEWTDDGREVLTLRLEDENGDVLSTMHRGAE